MSTSTRPWSLKIAPAAPRSRMGRVWVRPIAWVRVVAFLAPVRHLNRVLREAKNQPSERRTEDMSARFDCDRTLVRADREASSEQKYRVQSMVLDNFVAVVARGCNARIENRALQPRKNEIAARHRTATLTRYFCSQLASSSDPQRVFSKTVQSGVATSARSACALFFLVAEEGFSFLGLIGKRRSTESLRLLPVGIMWRKFPV